MQSMPSLLLDEPSATTNNSASERLRATMAAVRVMFTWLGTRKTLTPHQKSQAADTFGAERAYVSAGKKLLDTSHPAFKAVTSVRTRIIAYWHGASLPYQYATIRQDDIDSFTVQMTTLKSDLDEAVQQLDDKYIELKQAARRRLDSLYPGQPVVRATRV
jgi:hypothetical protein